MAIHDKLSDKEIETIIKLHKNGMTQKEIGLKVGRGQTTISNILVARNIKPNGRKDILSDKEIDSIANMISDGMSVIEVMSKTGRSERTIRRIVETRNLKIKSRLMTKDEKEVIIKLYENGLNTVQISKEIGRCQSTIERFLKKQGYDRFGKEQLSEIELNEIKTLYLEDKLNAQEIWELKFKDKFCKQYIERAIKEMGISRGQGRGSYNKTIVHDYFESIDNENKAYILGYIMADGSVTKDGKTLRLECTSKDVEILEFIKSEINKEANIFEYSREGRNSTNVMTINSIDVVKSLSKYGICENKQSKDIPMPKIDKCLLRHFIRGFFDGDGSITYKIGSNGKKYPSISICVTEEFGKQMEEILKTENIITSENNMVDMRKYGNNIHNLRITRIEDVRWFYWYLYKDSNFSLKRKKDKMFELIKNVFSYANTEITKNII